MKQENKDIIKQHILETLFAGAMGLVIGAGLWDGVI